MDEEYNIENRVLNDAQLFKDSDFKRMDLQRKSEISIESSSIESESDYSSSLENLAKTSSTLNQTNSNNHTPPVKNTGKESKMKVYQPDRQSTRSNAVPFADMYTTPIIKNSKNSLSQSTGVQSNIVHNYTTSNIITSSMSGDINVFNSKTYLLFYHNLIRGMILKQLLNQMIL